jgi:HSP20 family molecular chaperone IbpA
MAEGRVTHEQAPAKREAGPLNRTGDFFAPLFPVGRFFGGRHFGPLHTLSDDIEHAVRGFALAPKEDFWTPVVEVRKCNGELVVSAELPGIRKDDVNVELTEEALIIHGERKREHTEDHNGYHRTERSYGQFYRTIPLPEGARTDQVKAELTHGVLRVSIPTPETKKQPRMVPVETGSKTA